MGSLEVVEYIKSEEKILSSPDLFFQKHLDPDFFDFLKNLDGKLKNVENIHVLKKYENYDLHSSFKSKLIILNFDLNELQSINSFLREYHLMLKDQDFIAAKVELMEAKHRNIKHRHPFLYRFIILIEFIFKRLLPRMPITSPIIENLKLINKKVLSKCEILGRLIYNGFDIIANAEIGEHFYFLIKKSGNPSTYKVNRGIFFKQRRVGKDGKTFDFYKLRTMHPYAEFIQDYLIERNNFSSNGKVKDDFRVADWGRFLRRHWLDEIPGIFNLIKGDLRLFGVRPLSRGFFNLYPEDLQKERIKMKPGLVPPFYSDLPNSFEEVIESERRYLEKRKIAPLRTDFEYFIKALNNILLKGARSA